MKYMIANSTSLFSAGLNQTTYNLDKLDFEKKQPFRLIPSTELSIW